jgi:DNA-binding winged helix-turn-helix (wHTH) protein
MRTPALGGATEHPSEEALHFDRFTIDLRRGSLRSGIDEIWLRPKSFAVLRYLAQNAGRLILKDEIFSAVWPDSTVTSYARKLVTG